MRQLFLLVLCFYCTTLRAELSLQLESAKVKIGDTFHMTIGIKNSQDAAVPDLTPLQDNFRIVGTERSSNYSIVNGQASSIDQWTIFLIPLRVGIITIPPIVVGNEKTTPAKIEVTATTSTAITNKNSATNTTADDSQKQTVSEDIKMTAETDTSSAYVNQQILYTVKLFNSLQLVDTEVQPPQVDNALIVPLGEGKHGQTTENGRLYTFVEQQYAIFPQKSGSLTIKAPLFSAIVFDAVPQRIKVSAKPITLTVKAAPSSATKNNFWLPATKVILDESYDKDSETIQQGDVLTRVITLKATGMPAELLPNLKLDSTQQFSIYADKASTKNTYVDPNLVGISTTKFTYLLNKSGKITIPEFNLAWFNTTTRKIEYAHLPAKTLTVLANANSNTIKNDNNGITSKTENTSEEKVTQQSNFSFNFLPWLLAILFAAAWIVTLVRNRWPRQAPRAGKKTVLQRLEQACAANDVLAAKEALLFWSSWQWPNQPCQSLSDLTEKINDSNLKKELNILSEALYNSSAQKWTGEKLWLAISQYQGAKKSKQDNAGNSQDLPPLYP